MLRIAHGHSASPTVLRRGDIGFPPAIAVRPRVAPPAPVVPPLASRTVAVRGHVRNGSAAALLLEPGGVCIVSADRSRRRRVRRFAISQILAIEENRKERSSELVLLTSTTEIVVMDVDIGQAWTFCREVRRSILATSKDHASGSRGAGRGSSKVRLRASRYGATS
jgi:hypothetical protein